MKVIKKTEYVAPELEAIEIKTLGMLAASGTTVPGTKGDSSELDDEDGPIRL